MRSRHGRGRLALGTLLACSAAQVHAQATGGASAFTGSASLGVRNVDLSGTEAKYREDINLDDGVRLFGVHLRYAPGDDGRLDKLELDADGLGGDPFETIHFGVRKYGAYDLKLDRRRSQYFYEDTILPAAVASITGATGGDFHHFDFERVRDTAALDIDLSPATRLSFGLERQTRVGDGTTTLGVERDEFELAKPLDESLNALTFGVRHSFGRVTVIFDEQLREFENTSELFLPGASPGLNTTDPAELQFFMLDQSYDYDSRSHAVRVLAAPTEALDVRFGWRREGLDLDMQASESSAGTTFAGTPFTTSLGGPAAVGRDFDVADVEIGYAFGERVRLIGAARRSTLEQQGAVAFGPDVGSGAWDIATDAYEAGVEVAVTPLLSVAAGWSTEARTTSSRWTQNALDRPDRSDTDRDGYFARLAFRTDNGLTLTASVDDDSIDDAFALASPSASRRYRVGVRRQWDNGLWLSGSYRRTDVDNDTTGWAADTEQANVRLGYRRERFQLAAGYTTIDASRSIDQLVAAGTRTDLWRIAYAADSVLSDVSARWQVSPRIAVGGEFRAYDNRGSFRLVRDDRRAFLDVALGTEYALQVAYREVDYLEDAYDAYDAALLELALLLRW
jgi:hypothetical protein